LPGVAVEAEQLSALLHSLDQGGPSARAGEQRVLESPAVSPKLCRLYCRERRPR
jgi:hypothetical protein